MTVSSAHANAEHDWKEAYPHEDLSWIHLVIKQVILGDNCRKRGSHRDDDGCEEGTREARDCPSWTELPNQPEIDNRRGGTKNRQIEAEQRRPENPDWEARRV